jgi:hypothetical protein
MPRKKHRLSWMYEDLPPGPAADTPKEDTLSVSPVEVAYPSPAYDMAVEEGQVADTEPPAAEEAQPSDAPAEDYVADECLFAEEAPVAHELALAEEYLADESPAAEEVPAAAEPAAVEEMPAECWPVAEVGAALDPEAVQLTNVLIKSEVPNADGVGTQKAEKLEDQVGEVALVCISCTTMLLIEYDGPCPYKVTSTMGPNHESFSWLLHTTCLSCVKKHRHPCFSRDSFSDRCVAAFSAAMLSEDFVRQTRWFETTNRVCRKPTRILMGDGRRSVAYVKIDAVRDETTTKCRIRGLRPVGEMGRKGGRREIVESFAPGGFM